MLITLQWSVLPLLVSAVTGGWLDRAVLYRKEKFIQDLVDTLPTVATGGVSDESHQSIQVSTPEAALVPLPPGFRDHPEWDVDAVTRLLGVLRVSRGGRRVLRALRTSTRRWMINKQLSYKLFPSINDDTYYLSSDESAEDYRSYPQEPHVEDMFNDNMLVVVSNPVEARLPSGQISVAMLRHILEQRALAARGETDTILLHQQA